MKDGYTTNSHYLTYTFLFKRLGECTFWTAQFSHVKKSSCRIRDVALPFSRNKNMKTGTPVSRVMTILRSSLLQRLQEAEARNQELTESVTLGQSCEQFSANPPPERFSDTAACVAALCWVGGLGRRRENGEEGRVAMRFGRHFRWSASVAVQPFTLFHLSYPMHDKCMWWASLSNNYRALWFLWAFISVILSLRLQKASN